MAISVSSCIPIHTPQALIFFDVFNLVKLTCSCILFQTRQHDTAMAGGLAGMMFLPYYKHIMTVLETNKELKRTVKGNLHNNVPVKMHLYIVVVCMFQHSQGLSLQERS